MDCWLILRMKSAIKANPELSLSIRLSPRLLMLVTGNVKEKSPARANHLLPILLSNLHPTKPLRLDPEMIDLEVTTRDTTNLETLLCLPLPPLLKDPT
jgi:hypothetical protein